MSRKTYYNYAFVIPNESWNEKNLDPKDFVLNYAESKSKIEVRINLFAGDSKTYLYIQTEGTNALKWNHELIYGDLKGAKQLREIPKGKKHDMRAFYKSIIVS